MESQEEFVRRAQNSDAEAFAQLYKMIYRDLYRFAYYTLQNQQDAEDVVSEAVLDAYRTIRQLKEPQAFKSWIFKIVSNKCKQKKKEYLRQDVTLDENIPVMEKEMEDGEAFQAMKLLTKEERVIINMFVFGGYKGEEIGEILHTKHSTIRSKYRRALLKMKQAIELGM
ncbi:RNA polymerase sigma factor [Anaeromicropila populeti]|uniref:RNA polymerase sigma-70 factor, ECF subfamily n=1 Tax=Anaeromicropila populeti TaxID=37658 RepID=A0A1I6KS05_9FIRM|nr:RNA polymerase sigma factor [Anaeromicropila populeti]SFR93981.1 RNA polymerase sigma-70 factor, ECF subfamily [Anaeromicropila populeti]